MRFHTVALSVLVASLSCTAGCASDASDDGASKPSEEDVTSATLDKQIAAAAKGFRYVSGDADYPLTLAMADRTEQDVINEAFLRKAFASAVDKEPDADKPLARLYAEAGEFATWRRQFVPSDSECDRDCRGIDKLNALLARSLTDIQVFYFGSESRAGKVTGTTVSIFVVGKATIKVKDAAGRVVSKPKVIGIRTMVVWT